MKNLNYYTSFNGIPVYQDPDGLDFYTDNFSLWELRCRCAECQRSRPHKISAPQMAMFQDFRVTLGRAFTPNSAYRCLLHPCEGGKWGDHSRGIGMDVPCGDGLQKGEAIKVAIECGFNAIGVYDWGIHIAYRSGYSEGQLCFWAG